MVKWEWAHWNFSEEHLYRLMLIRDSGKVLCVYSSDDHDDVAAREKFLIEQELHNNPTHAPPEFFIYSINRTGFGTGIYGK